MRRLGLLGGMSWESSIEYETIINREVQKRVGGVASADLVIRSLNFAEIAQLQAEGDWSAAAALLSEEARVLEQAGAEAVVLCTNTMHKVAEDIADAVSIPFLHIADALLSELHRGGATTTLLLGTRFTMEQSFYSEKLTAQGMSVEVPGEEDRDELHRIIYEELVRGVVSQESHQWLVGMVRKHLDGSVDAVISGCTEIELLLTEEDVSVPFYPTTRIHALAAVDWSVGSDPA